MIDLLVVGGGAAGVFAALAAKQTNPQAKVRIIEQSNRLLAKVRLSGGGRCNLTNACSPLSAFVQNYPRGGKELQGPLHRFGPQQTIEWFESRGIRLKAETDGRIFPSTNSSETIVSCLSSELTAKGVEVAYDAKIQALTHEGGLWTASIDKAPVVARSVLLATGSSPSGYSLATALGHTICTPIPSLFALAVSPFPLSHIRGVCVDPVEVMIVGERFVQRGPLLITHTGFSGPAILKLSSWSARYLYERNYAAELSLNWLPDMNEEAIFHHLTEWKKSTPNGCIDTHPLFNIPKSLWRALAGEGRASALSHKSLRHIAHALHDSRYQIFSASPIREEFVTCGGIQLNEICWKTMESTICPRLFFAGELLDVDGLTGGFNLQNAWTTGWIAGSSSV